MSCQFGDRGTEPPTTVTIAGQQPMNFQAGCQPVRCGPWQTGAVAQFGQSTWRFRDRVQHPHGFIENANAAIMSHIEILASHIVRTRCEITWRVEANESREHVS